MSTISMVIVDIHHHYIVFITKLLFIDQKKKKKNPHTHLDDVEDAIDSTLSYYKDQHHIPSNNKQQKNRRNKYRQPPNISLHWLIDLRDLHQLKFLPDLQLLLHLD
eukprot:429321_1